MNEIRVEQNTDIRGQTWVVYWKESVLGTIIQDGRTVTISREVGLGDRCVALLNEIANFVTD